MDAVIIATHRCSPRCCTCKTCQVPTNVGEEFAPELSGSFRMASAA